MVFSLFGRKDKSDARRARGVFGVRVPDSTLRGPATVPSVEAQRELARRTAEKIDRIESEMIDAPVSVTRSDGTSQPSTEPMPAARMAPLFQPPSAQSLAPQRPSPEPLAGFAGPREAQARAAAPGAQSSTARPIPAPAPLPASARRAASPDTASPAPAASGARAPAQALSGLAAEASSARPAAQASADAPSAPPALAPLEFEPARPATTGIEVSASSLPPDLEEAAILYANGQAPAAAATLKASIARVCSHPDALQAWRMLFDVLQSMGARAEFEAVALQYAARFEKSPPAWQESVVEVPEPRRPSGAATMALPAVLDAGVHARLDGLRRAVASRRPVGLDFGAVRSVDPQGAALIVEAFAAFEKAGRELTVSGAQALSRAARAAIETGRRDPGDGCWQLALLALRLLGERQAFDDLSIDFCITYEVSPPSWEPLPACIRVEAAQAPGGPQEHAAASPPDGADAGVAAATSSAQDDAGAFPLRGEIVGRMLAELQALREWAGARTEVPIDCRALRRLDFVAAGELLNEVVTFCSAGRSVRFVEPGAMVEALLVVMGIHELADIRRRRI